MAGLGDTRLGDDATKACRMARGIEARARGEALMRALEGLDAKQRAAALEARTGATRVNWWSAGSQKDELVHFPRHTRPTHIARIAAHTPPQQRPQPQDSTTREHAALHAARTARARTALPPVAAPPNSKHHARTTTHDDSDEKDAASPQGHKAGDAGRWGTTELGRRPGNGGTSFLLPCERGSHSHTDVATRPRVRLALDSA